MEKYKNLVCVGPEVEQLLARKNIILKQINCLHLLAEKLGQCR